MKKIISVFTLLLLFHANCAFAETKKMSIEDIQRQVSELSAQVQKLSNIVAEQSQVIRQQDIALRQKESVPLTPPQEPDLNLSRRVERLEQTVARNQTPSDIRITKDPSPKFETVDGKFSFQPFGRVHLDATFFNNDKSDNDNNSNIRRARFGFKGKIGENLEYQSEMDFSEDEADIQDMTLTYTGFERFDITAGHHRPPVGFERNTSSNHNMFIERATSTNLFSANRKIGLSTASKAENYIISAGMFNEDAGGSNSDQGEDLSLDARAAANILGLYDDTQEHVFHLGLGYSYQKPSDTLRYRARPGVGDGSRFIDTGILNDVDTANIINAELVGVFGALSFQGEYFATLLDRSRNPDAMFDGYYAQAGYFLTGETRNYDGTSGLFKRTSVLDDFSHSGHGIGAWEVVARYDNTNLSDVDAGITGGNLDLYTLGLNWYLNKNVRIMNNLILVDSDENAATVPDDDPTIFKMRAQWDF